MEKFRVPQRKVPVRVRLIDGREIEGFLFAPATGPDGAPGRLVDRLNEEQELFLALADAGGGRLLRKNSVVAVRLGHEDGRLELHEGANAKDVHIEIRLEADLGLEGTVSYTMPPEKGRILDYLNAAPVFAPLRTAEGTTLFNLRRVIHVVDPGGSDRS